MEIQTGLPLVSDALRVGGGAVPGQFSYADYTQSHFERPTPVDHPSLSGFAPIQRASKRQVTEAARLYADCVTGKLDPFILREAFSPTMEPVAQWIAANYPGMFPGSYVDRAGQWRGNRVMGLRESMAVTDYQALFVDVLDRAYYGYWSGFPIISEQLCKVVNLRDFRVVKRYLLDGMVNPITFRDPAENTTITSLLGPVPQQGSTLGTATPTGAITYQPLLGQTGASINWAAFVNDDLGIFTDVSQRLAIAANRGVTNFIVELFFDTNGPNANLYKAAYKNRIVTADGAALQNPPLGIDGLSAGFDLLFSMKDSSGYPIAVSDKPIYLVYGPRSEVTAQNLAHMLSVYVQNRGGGTQGATGFPAQFLQTDNWLIKRVQPIMDPWIDVVVSTNKLSWLLVADPMSVQRPAVEIGYLNGYRTPQMFREMPNTLRAGGGVDPTLGNFFSMNQNSKIVSVIGGTWIDGRTTVGSNGSAT